jgi:Cu(I)/Ag(I) efflux system membrane protein CusA/SilA
VGYRLGSEFLPRIDEGDLLFMPTTDAGVRKEDAAEQLAAQDHFIKQFEEVKTVFGKVGRADTPTDPAPFSMAETTIRLRPRSEWPDVYRERWYSRWAPESVKAALRPLWPERTPRTLAGLIEELDRATRMTGWTNAWTAPVRARMDMLATGVHTPVGIRVVSNDPYRLADLGAPMEALAMRVPGARSAFFESVRDRPWPTFLANSEALAHPGVDKNLLKKTTEFMISGGDLGEFEWQGDPFRLALTLVERDHDAEEEPSTRSLNFLCDITVRSRGDHGQPVPLALLGSPKPTIQPAMVRSEFGELVAYVYVDLHPGVDPGHFVENAKAELEHTIAAGGLDLREGERIEWTGQYELIAQGEKRLWWIVPFVLLSMFALLLFQFRSVAEAAIVLLCVPFALVGSLWTLYWLGYSLSAPVWVGLLSTIGLAMQTGVVMVVYIDDAFHRRVQSDRIHARDDIVDAHTEGTVLRLRPKLMTIATMAASLLPLLWAEGAGAEIIRRVAAPMLGGLLSSAFLTLEVIPVVYTMWRSHQLEVAKRRKVRLAEVIGPVPTWAQA